MKLKVVRTSKGRLATSAVAQGGGRLGVKTLPSTFITSRTVRNWRSALSCRCGAAYPRYRRNLAPLSTKETLPTIFFMVVDGIVRRCKDLQNGTRAIVAFHTPGELFGAGPMK